MALIISSIEDNNRIEGQMYQICCARLYIIHCVQIVIVMQLRGYTRETTYKWITQFSKLNRLFNSY